jgi:sirohydrochlorin ferrochelatase
MVRMHAAGLRRAGFAATVALALLMLGAAIHGMTRVDTTLQLAAAAPPKVRHLYVVDVRERPDHRHRFGGGRCDEPPPGPRM